MPYQSLPILNHTGTGATSKCAEPLPKTPAPSTCRLRKLVIKPTLRCTANCPTCSNRRDLHKSMQRQPLLSLDQWQEIMDDAAALGVETLDISGGEPTLYRELPELIRIGRTYGWFVSLNSNGSLMSHELAQSLLEAGLQQISTSIYSPDPATHDAMRHSRGLWNKATTAVRTLIDLAPHYPGFRVRTQTLICRENYLQLAELLQLHYDLGSQAVSLAYLEGDFEKRYLLAEAEIRRFKAEQLPKLLEFTDQLEPKCREQARATLSNLFSEDILSLSEWATGTYRPRRLNLPACQRPQGYTNLLANGDVHPCNMIEYCHQPCDGQSVRQFTHGNLV